jgi:hypothetical protein
VLLSTDRAVGYELWVAGAGSATVTELNTLDGPVQTLAATTTAAAVAQTSMPLPGGRSAPVTYLSRAAWGADESLRNWTMESYPLQVLTVHHQGSSAGPDYAATVRAIYYDQAVTQGWGDIGYQALIDPLGNVYEGRYSGTDGAPAFNGTTADGRPLVVTGAHVYQWNVGNLGVCLLGNYTSTAPTAAAVNALTTVLAGFARVGRLDPLGTTAYLNPMNNNAKTAAVISGHRDWAATECPGGTFYATMGKVRSDTAAKLTTLFPVPLSDLIPRRSTSSSSSPLPRR